MKTIMTTAGTQIEADGDVLAILEAISRDLLRRNGLNYSFEDVDREFQAIVSQLSDEELRTYLKESLFMSFNRFENERLMRLIKKAESADAEQT